MVVRMPDSECPTCGHKFDSATHTMDSEVKPRPGDVSVCIECGEMLQFTDTLTVQLLPIEVYQEIAADSPESANLLFLASSTIHRHRFHLA